MPEWRKDPVVNRWVAIAVERGKRPHDFQVPKDVRKTDRCPLCPGNEKDTPPEVMAFREQGSRRDQPGWWIRVVPNKFPAVKIEASPELKQHGIYQYRDGFGAHEVIIESPQHQPGLDSQNEKQVEEVIWAWRERMQDLRKDTRIKYIQVFKNTGQVAGASLEHTHSQLVALPMIPVDVAMEIEGVKNFAAVSNRCVYCTILEQELKDEQRLILTSNEFIAFCPYASRFPFETMIIPRRHQHDFVQIEETQVKDLARVILIILRKLAVTLQSPPLNLVLHTAPVNEWGDFSQYHWHIEILPRLTIMAGFELGTGYYINPTPPELAAQYLRETEVIVTQGEYIPAYGEVKQYV